MTDNNGSQFATRDIRTHDHASGEELTITFFPRAGVVTVNGYSVIRSQKPEDLDEKAVFLRSLDDKQFAVSTDSLSELFFKILAQTVLSVPFRRLENTYWKGSSRQPGTGY